MLGAETFTGDHQPWGQPCTLGGAWSSGRSWGPSALHPSSACFQPQQLPHLVVPLVAKVLPVTGWPWDGRTGTLAPTPPAPPKTGSDHTLPLPDCHVGVSADWEQSLHSQSVLEPSANKCIARSLETHFPVFYLGFHCLCTCVNDVNSSSIDTG